MTKGQQYAIQILTAEELGKNVGYSKEAKKYLETGNINRALILHFAEESDKCVQWILRLNMYKEAMKIAEKYLQKLKTEK